MTRSSCTRSATRSCSSCASRARRASNSGHPGGRESGVFLTASLTASASLLRLQGLEDAIQAHFRALAPALRRQLAAWVQECSDPTTKQRMEEAVRCALERECAIMVHRRATTFAERSCLDNGIVALFGAVAGWGSAFGAPQDQQRRRRVESPPAGSRVGAFGSAAHVMIPVPDVNTSQRSSRSSRPTDSSRRQKT